ncbi:MAG TPA: 2OG-Fe(II) oxygenase [Terriglobales bacterium]|nr:2OG-Fe(II) oxygenase [Terriglobales bacterium]
MPSISPTSADLALPPAEPLRPEFAREAYVVCAGVLSAERARELRARALALVQEHARRIEQQSDEHVLRYRVVTGDVLRDAWPELFALYDSPRLRAWVAAVAGVPQTFLSTHLQSAINVNALGEPGEVYRWHFDATGFTLLLYLSDSVAADGGALEMRVAGAVRTLLPVAGTAVLMDGTRCQHRVAPILRRHERISVPMVFTTTPDTTRPPGLDDYLYR